MNVPSTTVRPPPDLYPPPPRRDINDFLAAVGTEMSGGKVELKRALTPAEQTGLRERANLLLPWLQGSSAREIKAVLMRCFSGFGGGQIPIEEVEAIAVQFILVLAGQPKWAVARACMRFAAGDVRPEEVGAKRLDLGWRPTTAQLKTIVDQFTEPLATECRRITMTLRAPAPRPIETEEQRKAGLAKIEAWRAGQGIKDKTALETPERTAQREDIGKRLDELHRARIRREYVERGLDPPEDVPGKMLVGLPLLLEMGWTIQTGPRGKPVLVKPREQPPREHSHADEGR